MMKAVAFTYHSTETKIVQVPIPEVGENDALIKVKFAALDTGLEAVVGKTSSGGYLHKFTEPLFCGWHYSGTVEAIGSKVGESIQVGDEVFGHLPYSRSTEQGSLAEYITVPASTCAIKPAAVPSDVAAASTTESLTALQALRDYGRLQEDSRVLIHGAAGGVGMAAVQWAKRLGAASITAVCSTKDVERVRELGADVVLDRKKTPDVLSQLEPNSLDIIFDTPSALPIAQSLGYLKRGGHYVLTNPHWGMAWGFLVGLFTGKGVQMFVVESNKADLELLATQLQDD